MITKNHRLPYLYQFVWQGPWYLGFILNLVHISVEVNDQHLYLVSLVHLLFKHFIQFEHLTGLLVMNHPGLSLFQNITFVLVYCLSYLFIFTKSYFVDIEPDQLMRH